jgi:hypothetical protein
VGAIENRTRRGSWEVKRATIEVARGMLAVALVREGRRATVSLEEDTD